MNQDSQQPEKRSPDESAACGEGFAAANESFSETDEAGNNSKEAAPQAMPSSFGLFGPYRGNGTAGDLAEGRKLFLWFFLLMLIFSLYLLYYMMQPFLHSIILACVFTAITYPLYQHCLGLLGGRRIPAALMMIVFITLLLAVLVTIFVAGLVPQAKTSITAVNQWLAGAHLGDTLNTHLDPILQQLQEHFPELELSIKDIRESLTSISSRTGQYLISSASSIVGNTLTFIANVLLTLLIMFFFFIDGENLLKRLAYLFPMKPDQTAIIIESLRKMSRAVLVGGFSVAVLQGIVGGIGLAVVDIPPLFWGSVMAFAALVPVVGTGLVWVPACIFLLIMDQWKSALFLALWCGLLVTSIDSVLRPILLRGGAKMPLLFLFMAILGGVNVFGMLGILYGPMILGLVAVMLDIYAEEYNDILSHRAGIRN